MPESAPSRPDTSDLPAVHDVFRSSLASAPAFVGGTEGDDDRRALVANYYANLMAFLEVHHDGEEQIVFPRLLERAPEHRATVERVEAQHVDVVARMMAVNASVRTWEARGDVARTEVLRSLRDLDEALAPHLDEEEKEILPLAGDYLTAEEWGMLPGQPWAISGGTRSG